MIFMTLIIEITNDDLRKSKQTYSIAAEIVVSINNILNKHAIHGSELNIAFEDSFNTFKKRSRLNTNMSYEENPMDNIPPRKTKMP